MKELPDELFVFSVRGRRVKSGHYESGQKFDLCHLRDGRGARSNQRAHSGRPQLAAEIMSASIERLRRLDKRSVKIFIRSVSYFWWSLDAIEAADPQMPRVLCLADITEEAWNRFCWHVNAETEIERLAQIYHDCREAVLAASAAAGIARDLPVNWLEWNPVSSRRSIEPPYDVDLEARILEAFQRERHRTERRFGEATRLADAGLPPEETLANIAPLNARHRFSVFTPENTLRFVRDRLLVDIPDFAEFAQEYGFQSREIGLPPDAISTKIHVTANPKTSMKKDFGSGLGLSALYRWFVPLQFDVIPFVCELVHLDGFNLSPVLSLDRNRWYLGDAESGSVTIVSRKGRSGGQPLYKESGTGPDSAYRIIRRAIELTQPLHDYVLRRLGQLRAAPLTEDGEREIEKLRELESEVWLAMTTRPIGVVSITDNDRFFEIANEILKRHEIEENGQPVKWSSKRIRDGYAEDIHVASRFSPKALQNALDHRRLGTSGRYLHQPRSDLREVGMMVRRLTGLLDDPERASNWPKRFIPTRERSMAQTPRLFITDEGARWLEKATPETSALKEWISANQPEVR